MKRRNYLLAVLLTFALTISSVMPVLASDAVLEDAAVEGQEMTEEEFPEISEQEQPAIPEEDVEPDVSVEPEESDIPEDSAILEEELLSSPEGSDLGDIITNGEISGEPEKETSTETSVADMLGCEGEMTKELVAQDMDTSDVSVYAARQPVLYYRAFKLYDENKQFLGVEIDQYTNKNESLESHWVTYVWDYESDSWGMFKYSPSSDQLVFQEMSGTFYYNIWGNMDWLLRAEEGFGIAVTGYQLDLSEAAWDYTYTANDVKKDMQHKEWTNTMDVPDALYKGAGSDIRNHAGLRPIKKNIYYLLKDGTMVRNKKLTVNGKVYLFGSDCKCYKSYVPVEEGWVKKSDGYYWLQDDNTILRKGGWQTLGGSKYFLAYKSGRRKTGWQTWKGNKYYMAPATGRLVTGLKTIEGNTYFLQYKTGEMVTGWKTLNGKNYYFNEQTGIMKRGMLTLNGKKYYFEKDGTQHFGWRFLGGKAYFFDKKTGVMKQNTWIIDGNYKYYANKNGTRFSGIRSIKGQNYYFQEDGKLVTNKENYEINGKFYEIDENGVLTEKVQ